MIQFTLTSEAGDVYRTIQTGENLDFLNACQVWTETEFMRIYRLYGNEPSDAQKLRINNEIQKAFVERGSFEFTKGEKFLRGTFEELKITQNDKPEPFSIKCGELDAWEYVKTLLETSFEGDSELFDETLKGHIETLNKMFVRGYQC